MPLGRYAAAALAFGLLVLALPSCSQTANVTDVYMALDADGTRRREVFYTDTKEIHCIVEAGIGRPGVTVEGTIRQLEAYDFVANTYVPTNAIMAYTEIGAERSRGKQLLDIQLEPGTPADHAGGGADNLPYIAGRYQCEVLLDGALEGTAIFNVAFPPCPPTIIPNGIPCFGFYRENDQCPANGAGGAPDPKCSCTVAEGWKC